MFRRATLLATIALSGALAGSAHAADIPVSTTWVTDGPVNAVTYDPDGRAYVGGDFSMVGPRLGSGLALTSASDVPAAGFPDINGVVAAAVPDGAGGEFIGGTFTSVGGVPRNRLAHIKADGTLDAGWNPGANNTVRALALSPSGDTLYVGGDFFGANSIGGQNHLRLAKLSAATGAVDANWVPGASASVRALSASASSLYIGGVFNSVSANNGSTSGKVAKVDAAGAGDIDLNWTPVVTGVNVSALALSGPDLYVGGNFAQVNATNRAGLAKLASGGSGAPDPTWNPDPIGEVHALQVSGPDLFVGGLFFTVGGQNRAGIAKLATTGTGAADATWDPGQPGTEVDALALSGGELVVGGSFFGIGGSNDRPYVAKLATTGTGAATSWKPNPNNRVRALATAGSSIFVGGEFSSAGPLNKFRGALIRLGANGSLDEAWDPQVSPGGVQALSLQGTDLIIGGSFVKVHGTSHFGLAKLSTEGSGALDATWATQAITVKALARSGDDLFVGGDFSGPNSVGNQTRNRIAKVSAVGTGTVDATWNPDASPGEVDALAVSGSSLFVGGTFFQIGGENRIALAKLSTTGAGAADPTWVPDPTGPVSALLVSGSSLYVGGSFSSIGAVGRSRVAKLSTSGAGTVDPAWAPNPNGAVTSLALSGDNLYVGGAYGSISGQPRNRLARLSATGTGAVDPAFEPAASNNGGAVTALAATGSRVLAGGTFNTIGPLSTSNLAIFDLTTPTLSLTSPFDGARYRQGQTVAAAYTCDDPDGPADALSCTGNVAAGAPIDTATPGAKTFTATATDAGSRSVSSTVNYFVDGSAPEISLAIPSQDAVYSAGTQVPVTFGCTDEDGPADVASCAGTAPAGSQLDASVNGTHTFTVTSADAVGNTSTKSVTYRVIGNPEPPKPPALSAFSIKPAKFKAKNGARVSFKLSKAATVTFKVTRKKGKKTVTLGSFTRKAKRGANAFKFRSKVKGKTLKPGAYRMAARAKDAGGLRSKTLTKPFRVLKP
jgi:hypothetical protein